ncbi:hypothetical protein N656DRAFT_785524 [Canariomyces notabilis]|uniref:Uncharacterized protein n=1 Tax=Canariomyces notabilis TaxID=2074819 RepID=A0AAN6T7L4_9PEZI|nr:hypothetical protein N656DRAFT_785524 [Canariomyces arenarius]
MMPSQSEHQPFLPKDATSKESDLAHTHRSARSAILSNSLVFVFTSLLWLIVVTFALRASENKSESTGIDHGHRHNVTTNAKLLTCGNSTAEARDLGCKYDVFLNNWVPPPCYDEEWIAEYLEDNSWSAYADENLTQQLELEQMEDRDFYYTSFRDHINHCATMWNKQFWALYEERMALDTVIVNPAHTEHCAQFLRDASEVNANQATKTNVGFAGCWIRARIYQ